MHFLLFLSSFSFNFFFPTTERRQTIRVNIYLFMIIINTILYYLCVLLQSFIVSVLWRLYRVTFYNFYKSLSKNKWINPIRDDYIFLWLCFWILEYLRILHNFWASVPLITNRYIQKFFPEKIFKKSNKITINILLDNSFKSENCFCKHFKTLHIFWDWKLNLCHFWRDTVCKSFF